MNRFGRVFSVALFGESHGSFTGCTIDGCPAGVSFTHEDMHKDLERRKGGKPGTTKRVEKDIPEIISGIKKGKTTGAPLTVIFENRDYYSSVYDEKSHLPRPSHVDFAAGVKYSGFNDIAGGGHLSGRMTLPLVAAGSLARKLLKNISISAEIEEAGGKKNYYEAIKEAEKSGDSLGALISCCISGVPVGLGDPFFGSVESGISAMLFSIPGIKGVSFGSGFDFAKMKGSKANDEIVDTSGKTRTNHSGGVNGGISNGNDICFSVAVRPTPTISLPQKTVNLETGKQKTVLYKGRHDVCFALRLPVIIEAAAAIVLSDLKMLRRTEHGY